MDVLANQFSCTKHKQEYYLIQVQAFAPNSNNVFFCRECYFEKSECFASKYNFVQIEGVIQYNGKQIVPNWPPLNDKKIIENLSKLTCPMVDWKMKLSEVSSYFAALKKDILDIIDKAQKKMIQSIEELECSKVIEQYKEISKISELKELLLRRNNNNVVFDEYQKECREFINKVEFQKYTNSNIFQSVIDNYTKKALLYNQKQPQLLKDQILQLIESISFFAEDTNKLHKQDLHKQDLQSLLIDQKPFQIPSEAKGLSNILVQNPDQKQSVQSLEKVKANLVSWQKLSSDQMNLIQKCVDHQVKLIEDSDYSNQIKTSTELKQIKDIMGSKTNFLSSDFLTCFDTFLLNTYPILKQIEFTNIFEKEDMFKVFKALPDKTLNGIYNQVIERSFHLMQQIQNQQREEGIQRKQQKQFVIQRPYEMTFIEANLKQNQFQNIVIDKNSFFIINDVLDKPPICISHQTLQRSTKYLFRFIIEAEDKAKKFFRIGLTRNSYQTILGCQDQLCCSLIKEGNSILKDPMNSFGIDTLIKGDKFQVSEKCIIEMRIHLEGQILQVLDYPNYSSQLDLKSELKEQLKELNDLSLFINICNTSMKVVLSECYTVNTF